MVPSTKLRARSQLLTKSSWDPGWLTSTRRVSTRDQLSRGDTWHTWDSAPAAHTGNRAAGTREMIRHTSPQDPHHTWEECTCQAPGRLSWSDLGRAQKVGPTESAPLWSTREHELECLRPGKCRQPRACFSQSPCRATWILSSVDRESTYTVSRGKPSVAKTLWALPTHVSDICLQCYSLPTARLNKWA